MTSRPPDIVPFNFKCLSLPNQFFFHELGAGVENLREDVCVGFVFVKLRERVSKVRSSKGHL